MKAFFSIFQTTMRRGLDDDDTRGDQMGTTKGTLSCDLATR